jgi:hypothetical protein
VRESRKRMSSFLECPLHGWAKCDHCEVVVPVATYLLQVRFVGMLAAVPVAVALALVLVGSAIVFAPALASSPRRPLAVTEASFGTQLTRVSERYSTLIDRLEDLEILAALDKFACFACRSFEK